MRVSAAVRLCDRHRGRRDKALPPIAKLELADRPDVFGGDVAEVRDFHTVEPDRAYGARMDLTLINLEEPAETRTFPKGKFEVYNVGPATIGRATYEPGWRWSDHVGSQTGQKLCQVEHVGLVVSGRAAVAMEDGTERVMVPGDFFYVPPGHDSWVVGEEPYVSLHIMGSEEYAKDS
jgi:quercetin dioxygenase-like cupin family protein